MIGQHLDLIQTVHFGRQLVHHLPSDQENIQASSNLLRKDSVTCPGE